MQTYISLLRGINVSGQKKILMKDLRALYESLGLTQVTTYIQSGNVIFESEEIDRTRLQAQIETKIQQEYNFEVPVTLRSTRELQDIIKTNPFAHEVASNSKAMYLTFLSAEPSEDGLSQLAQFPFKNEQYIIQGKEVYLIYPDGYGKTKLTNQVLEKKLNVSATTRNWRTVNKLFEMTRPDG